MKGKLLLAVVAVLGVVAAVLVVLQRQSASKATARADSLQAALQATAAARTQSAAQAESLQSAIRQRAAADSLQRAASDARARARADSLKREELQRPKVLSLIDSPAIEIPAQAWVSYNFALDGTGNCRVEGRVLGLAGGREDVEVYVLNDDDFINWKSRQHGYPSAPFNMGLFHSDRQKATSLDLPIPGRGTYHLVISNFWSVSTKKTVQARASVSCVGGSAPQAAQ